MIFEICASVATVAFVALVIYAILTLRKIGKLLEHIDATVEPLGVESHRLLQQTNDLAALAKADVASLNPIFETISELGGAVQQLAHSSLGHEKKNEPKNRVEEIIQLVALGILLLQQIKTRR